MLAQFNTITFGTGGLRGLMGTAADQINLSTIGIATQALVNYLKSIQTEPLSVFVGYDNRHLSTEFADITARVLVANQIKVYLTETSCPTPLVSFGCRQYGCHAAIMITASHNPPEYNGFKVFWSDGAQILEPHVQNIQTEMQQLTQFTSVDKLDESYLIKIGSELDVNYLSQLQTMRHNPPTPIKIRYSPLHGTGIRIIPAALHCWGYDQVNLVELQANKDPDFPYAPKPNPEEVSAMELGSQQLLLNQEDLFLATDPDADRLGVVVLHEQQAIPLTGHQIACLALYHLASKNRFSSHKPICIKTIVTTELFRKIATGFQLPCIDVLTGFKYIADQISYAEKEHASYLFGAEESLGYLFGNLTRDKDAIAAACLIAEIAAEAKQEKLTLVDRLQQLYQLYGIHRESLTTIPSSSTQIQATMERLRHAPPTSLVGIPVLTIEDFLTSINGLPPANVLRFWLADGSKLVLRPSGTEPSIKIYVEVMQEKAQSIADCDQRLATLTQAFRQEVFHEF